MSKQEIEETITRLTRTALAEAVLRRGYFEDKQGFVISFMLDWTRDAERPDAGTAFGANNAVKVLADEIVSRGFVTRGIDVPELHQNAYTGSKRSTAQMVIPLDSIRDIDALKAYLNSKGFNK